MKNRNKRNKICNSTRRSESTSRQGSNRWNDITFYLFHVFYIHCPRSLANTLPSSAYMRSTWNRSWREPCTIHTNTHTHTKACERGPCEPVSLSIPKLNSPNELVRESENLMKLVASKNSYKQFQCKTAPVAELRRCVFVRNECEWVCVCDECRPFQHHFYFIGLACSIITIILGIISCGFYSTNGCSRVNNSIKKLMDLRVRVYASLKWQLEKAFNIVSTFFIAIINVGGRYQHSHQLHITRLWNGRNASAHTEWVPKITSLLVSPGLGGFSRNHAHAIEWCLRIGRAESMCGWAMIGAYRGLIGHLVLNWHRFRSVYSHANATAADATLDN